MKPSDPHASVRANDDIGLMPVKLGLGDTDGGIEIVVGQGRIENLVAVIFKIGRLYAARSRLPAVKEEDEHVIIQVRKGPTNNGPILPELAFS